jgi:hypothetical protein
LETGQPALSTHPAPTIAIIPATPALSLSLKDAGSEPILAAVVTNANVPSSPTSPASTNLSPTSPSQKKSSTLPSLSESDSGLSTITSSTSVDDDTPQTSNKTDGPPKLTLQRQSGDFATGLGKILESPVEEHKAVLAEEKSAVPIEETTEKEPTSTVKVAPEVQVPSKQPASGGKPQRRRSLMIFFGKRDKMQRTASEHTPSSEKVSAAPIQRQGGLLRSVVGTISRSRRRGRTLPTLSETEPQKDADIKTSKVVAPASPTSPTSPSSPVSPTSPVRASLAPTMHNRGTITTRANALDDESQRVCEIHFLT